MLCPWNISNVDIINEVITVLISDAIGIKWLRSKAKKKRFEKSSHYTPFVKVVCRFPLHGHFVPFLILFKRRGRNVVVLINS